MIRSVKGRAHYDNVLRCGSVWECPVCMRTIKVQRANEVQSAVAIWGRERVLMVTLTVRHGLGDDLAQVRRGVSTAWSKTLAGAPFVRFKDSHGVAHYIRAMEVNHGPNGFHPHLHALVFLDHEPSDGELHEMESWLFRRWAERVRGTLGAPHVPTEEHGVRVTRVVRANYIQKLGLELSDPGTKRAATGYRTPMQIARDFRDEGRATDGRIWQAYTRGMKGARQLTWSNHSRKKLAALGLLRFLEAVARGDVARATELREQAERLARAERTDEELMNGECENEEKVIALEPEVWNVVRTSAELPPLLLDLAESGGEAAVAHAISGPLRAGEPASSAPSMRTRQFGPG